ncbi:prominin-like protein isoform X2 [Epargyreus clarus]|uniref:prominin-like protein isoform X2 n=1 Tax=Epargyreus clarus TaxID=520877 RepID=UPI003C30DC1F
MRGSAMWQAAAVGWLAACWAGGAAADSWLTDIGHNLRAEMSEVMDMGSWNYSTPVINATYVAKLEFDMRAMGHLYNSTHVIIDVIANKQAYPPGVVQVEDGHVEVRSWREKWRELLAHYAGPAAVLIVAALLAAALPLTGLFWCCCQWCRVGRRRRPFDRKYDACLKGLLAILLIAILTLFLFGVVCAFATDSQVESGAARAPGAVRAGLRDVRTFLNATQAHARHLLVVNYQELEHRLSSMLTASGHMVSLKLGEFSRASSVTTLNRLVQQLDAVRDDLRAVHNVTAELRADADTLNAGLRKVKSQLLQTLAQCQERVCVQLQEKYKIGQLDTEIQYNRMPDVSSVLRDVSAVLESNIRDEVAAGQAVFTDIRRGIQRSVDRHIPDVHDAITDIGRRLAAVADEITWQAANASARVAAQSVRADQLQALLQQYGPYRRVLGAAAAVALLLIICVMAWGLVCGVCGKRPDVYGGGDCCNKAQGSTCLLCGIGLTFLLGGGVALVLAAYFAVGISAQRFICDPLTEPRDNRLFEDVNKLVELEYTLYNERSDPDFNLTSVLVMCHDNYTIYETLQLHRLYDLARLQAEADAELARRTAALRPAMPRQPPLRLLHDQAKDKLRRLAATGLSEFDFDRILHALETNMTSLALDGLAAQLEATARSVETRAAFAELRADLRAAAALLLTLHRDVVARMLHHTNVLNETATKLRDGLRFNHSSLKEAISYLMDETEQAEKFLNTQGPDLIQNMTREWAGAVGAQLSAYLQRVERAARRDVGRCGPLSAALNATRDAACRAVLVPANGYWISLAWCVLLFAPALLVAQRLARLYRHADPYPGPLVEAAYKAEKRAGRGRREAEGGASSAGGGVGGGAGAPGAGHALAPPLDAHHARRYNDMAPKHWEEGPPRYHGPTEYERPPPYYYPGPNDRQ